MSGTSANGNPYYGSQAAAVAYLTDSITPAAAAFIAAAPKQIAALVSATRVIDRQAWNADSDTFAKRDALTAFQNASYELAALLVVKPNLFAAQNADSNVQSVTAGPTSVTFFGPTDVGRFPPIVQELIGKYLAGASATVGGSEQFGGGECAESSFDDSDRYSLI